MCVIRIAPGIRRIAARTPASLRFNEVCSSKVLVSNNVIPGQMTVRFSDIFYCGSKTQTSGSSFGGVHSSDMDW